MSFWEQLNRLLSESPGNIIFHLVTLFAIQATLAIALGQWRRERELEGDGQGFQFVRRLTLAALGLLVTRLILLAVSLIVAANADATLPSRILPPLEQFINTTMAILIVWALVPIVPSLPRLTDVAAVLLLLLAGVMYAFFAQNWAMSAQAGMTYNGSDQSTIWGIFQVAVLVAGTLALLFRFEPGLGLRLFALLALLAAHFAQLWNYPETVPTQSEIPFWIRLGHLVVLPLLAIVAYRHVVDALIAARLTNRPAPEQVANALQWAGRVIGTPSVQSAAREGVNMVAALTGARFAAIATRVDDVPDQLNVLSAGTEVEQPKTWALNMRDWPAFRLALDQEQPVELLPDGVGARQLHDLYQELGMPARGSMLVSPLISNGEEEGVLLLGGSPQGDTWPDSAVAVATTLATYLGQVLSAARSMTTMPEADVEVADTTPHEIMAERPEPQAVISEPEPVDATIPEIGAGRLIVLEQERDKLLEENQSLQEQLAHSETRLQSAEQRAHDLAATIDEYERTRSGDDGLAALEAEISALRESLAEAEDALAMAAASEGELSTEWVTTTISRYSGELEEAQERIAELEQESQQREPGAASELVTSLAQELRTPLTSIAGYTDLLLGETMGILGTRQRDFLQRVRSNVERMGMLLEQIVQLAATPPAVAIHDVEMVDVRNVIDNAVNAVIAQLRKKELRLNFDIADSLPPVPANRDALSQVLIHLLNNASEVSQMSDEVTISAHTDTFQDPAQDDEDHIETFLHVSVRDAGGGIRPEDRSHVFDPQYRADHPLIEGLGDTGAGLAVANRLVSAHGGRVWVDSDVGSGSTFSVLLPLSNNGQDSDEGR